MTIKLNQANVPFRARVVILGASNVTRGISTVVESLRLLLGSPLEIFAAIGHGRSYGMHSTVLVRTLPGILHCNLWNSLATSLQANPNTPTHALITDIGNDIMYGASPQQVTAWVGECIDRLRAVADERRAPPVHIAMTMVPIEGIRALRRWEFAIVKSILFPSRRLTFEDALQRAEHLAALIVDLAKQREVKPINPRREWYGFDPIHIRHRSWPAAWKSILGESFALHDSHHSNSLARSSLVRWAKIRSMMPERYWLAGLERRTQQPVGRLSDGTTLHLF